MGDVSIDHLIFFARDPAEWQKKLASAGITAVYRDEGPGSDKHILAAFAGDSYLEVIRLPARPEDAHLPWEARLSVHGEGFGGFCLSVPDVAAALSAAYPEAPTEQGEFGNTVIGTGEWRVRHGAPADHVDVTTPFLLQTLTGRGIRATTTQSAPHAAGVTRFAGIVLSVGELAAFRGVYAAFGPIETAPALEWSAGEGAMVRLGSQWIGAWVPKAGSAQATMAAARGYGPVEMVLARGANEATPEGGEVLAGLMPLAIRVC